MTFRKSPQNKILTPNKERKILYVPSNYLTSERYYHARSTMVAGINDIRGYTLKNWFLEDENIKYLTKQMFEVYLNNDYKYKAEHEVPLTFPFFENRVPEWMREFADKEEIERYVESPESIYTSDHNQLYKYYIEALSKINKVFFKKYYYLIKKIDDSDLPGMTGKPDINVYRQMATIGTKNEFENTIRRTSLYDLVYDAEAWKQMDVYREYNIERWNKNFRYRNEIPIWQNLSRGRIGLDRSNEGLHDGNSSRASLDTPIRGYNMEDVYKYTSLQYNRKNQYTGV